MNKFELINILKAKDIRHLIRKVITDKTGKVTTVYEKPAEDKNAGKIKMGGKWYTRTEMIAEIKAIKTKQIAGKNKQGDDGKLKVVLPHWDESSLSDMPAIVTLKPTTRVLHKKGHYFLNLGGKTGKNKFKEISEVVNGDFSLLNVHRKNWKKESIKALKSASIKEHEETAGERTAKAMHTLVPKAEYDKRKNGLNIVLNRLKFISEKSKDVVRKKSAKAVLGSVKKMFDLPESVMGGATEQLLTTMMRQPKKVDKFINTYKTK